MKEAYNSEVIFNSHERSLDKFITFSENNDIELTVVIYHPFLGALEMSNELYVNKINNYFKSKGIKTINVSDLVQGIPVSDLVVNEHDSHGSEKDHALVANQLLEIIK